MELKRSHNKIELNLKNLIIFAIISGTYTAIMAILPFVKDTSFSSITTSFEVWILFGILIIMSSKSAKESALKCFLFFLISQPLIYLLQVPFSSVGWNIFGYYRRWFALTVLTIPMGFIGYYMKKDKWWRLIILTPILLFLGYHYSLYFKRTVFDFPYYLLSTLFCLVTLLAYPLYIFKNKKIKIAGATISILIILVMSVISLSNKLTYNAVLLASSEKTGFIFDENYTVCLENPNLGDVTINFNNNYKTYVVNAEFVKAGNTSLILKDPSGDETVFNIKVKLNTYKINKA